MLLQCGILDLYFSKTRYDKICDSLHSRLQKNNDSFTGCVYSDFGIMKGFTPSIKLSAVLSNARLTTKPHIPARSQLDIEKIKKEILK